MSDDESGKAAARRDFLAKLLMGGGLLGSGVLAGRHGLAFVFPAAEAASARRLLVGREGELAMGQAKQFQIGGQSLYLVNTVGGYRVFSATCPHLGCTVKWEAHRDRFYCPCHQAVFSPEGAVVEGPPPRPLDEFQVEVDGELVYMWIDGLGRGGLA